MQKKSKNKKDLNKKNSSPEKILPQRHDEDFNTDDHKSSSARNVGPGYDDTGLGNDAEASLNDEPGDQDRNGQKKRNQKSQKK